MKLTVVDRVELTGLSLTGEPLAAPVAELVLFRCLAPPKDRHVTAGVEPSAMSRALDANTRTLDRSLCAFLFGGWPEEWVAAETLTDLSRDQPRALRSIRKSWTERPSGSVWLGSSSRRSR